MRRTIKIADIDQYRSEICSDITFVVDNEPEQFRRWRPAIVRGDTIVGFLDSYYRHIAPVPWSGVITIHNSEVVGDGLILQENILFVGKSLMYPTSVFPYPHSMLKFESKVDSYEVDMPSEVIVLEGITAHIVCDGWQIYGHWLVDVLPRLHRVMTSGIKIDNFLLPGPPRDWQLQMLDAIGLPLERCRFVDFSTSTVRCEQMVVPTYDRYNSEIRPTLTHVHEMLRQQTLGKSLAKATRDLFVSRKVWGGSRQLINRVDIETEFEKLGFEIVYPETLSFLDQIRLFASARSVVGECGSGMHNAVFSSAGTKIGVLQSESNLNFLQSQISMVLDHEIYYMLGRPSSAVVDNFVVELQDIRYVASMIKRQYNA